VFLTQKFAHSLHKKLTFLTIILPIMANVKVLLDQRRAKSDGTFNIIFRITDCKKVCTINSGVSIDEKYWNEKKV
jgi:hypothetical protein